jgi:hypothetical protein
MTTTVKQLYNHPVLWTQQRKRIEDKKFADEYVLVQKQHKEQQRLAKLRENKEVRFKVFFMLYL